MTNMKRTLRSAMLGLAIALALTGLSCVTQPQGNSNLVTTVTPSPSPSPKLSPKTETPAVPVTLPVLDALFADESFKTELKSKLQLTDEEIGALQKIAGDEVARLRQTNAEEQDGSAAEARERAARSIGDVIGKQKSKELF